MTICRSGCPQPLMCARFGQAAETAAATEYAEGHRAVVVAAVSAARRAPASDIELMTWRLNLIHSDFMGLRDRDFPFFAARTLNWAILVLAFSFLLAEVTRQIDRVLVQRQTWGESDYQLEVLEEAARLVSNIMHVTLLSAAVFALVRTNRFTYSLLRVVWAIWLPALLGQTSAVELVWRLYHDAPATWTVWTALRVSVPLGIIVPHFCLLALFWRYSRLIDQTRIEEVSEQITPMFPPTAVLSYATISLKPRVRLRLFLIAALASIPFFMLLRSGISAYGSMPYSRNPLMQFFFGGRGDSLFEWFGACDTGFQIMVVLLGGWVAIMPLRGLLVAMCIAVGCSWLFDTLQMYEVNRMLQSTLPSVSAKANTLVRVINLQVTELIVPLTLILIIRHRDVYAGFR